MTADDTSWTADFVACLSATTLAEVQIEKAMMLKYPHLPRQLYRYRAVNEYSLKNLNDNTEWVSSATAYNDPYDCALTFSTEETGKATSKATFDEIAAFAKLETVLTKDQLDLARTADDPIDVLLRALLKNEMDPDPAKGVAMLDAIKRACASVIGPTVDNIRHKLQSGMKVCSFTPVNDSIIMWSHYADYHKGFCVQYDLDDLDDVSRRALYPVIYARKLFDATPYFVAATGKDTSFNNLFGILAAIHKSPEWAYEREWRFVLPMGASFPDTFQMPKPRRLFLVSVRKVLESYESFVIQRRRPDSEDRQCGRTKIERPTIAIIRDTQAMSRTMNGLMLRR